MDNNVRNLRKKNKMSQQELADRLNVSRSLITAYENGRRNPSTENLKKISELFKVSIDEVLGFSPDYLVDFFGGQTHYGNFVNAADDIEEKMFSLQNSAKRRTIPVLGRVPAGYSLDSPEYVDSFIDVSPDLADTPDLFGLIVFGDSMSPVLEDKDIIVVQLTPNVKSGEMVVWRQMSDDVSVKWMRKENGEVEFVPENSKYKSIKFSSEQVQSIPISIVGKVVEYRRNTRHIHKKF